MVTVNIIIRRVAGVRLKLSVEGSIVGEWQDTVLSVDGVTVRNLFEAVSKFRHFCSLHDALLYSDVWMSRLYSDGKALWEIQRTRYRIL